MQRQVFGYNFREARFIKFPCFNASHGQTMLKKSNRIAMKLLNVMNHHYHFHELRS